jgi:hypothetical protein
VGVPARPEPAHSRAGVVVPRLHSEHLPGLRACQWARLAPTEERSNPISSSSAAPFLQITGNSSFGELESQVYWHGNNAARVRCDAGAHAGEDLARGSA